MSTHADELVNRYILRQYKEDEYNIGHLAACPDAVVSDADASNGSYGCDTGCEYVRFEAVISCPHGEREEYEYGEFGDLAGVIEDLEREEQRGR